MKKEYKNIVDKAYDLANETTTIIMNENCFVSFTRNFKYLGTWITYDIYDDYD